MKNVIVKDTIKEIKNTFKRFLSILLVVLLGVGFFAGIKAASPDMKKTVDQYFDDQNVMDIQILSTLGLTQKDIETLKTVENVKDVEGSYFQDVIVAQEEKETVVKLEIMNPNMNQLVLLDGKMPETDSQCVVEKDMLEGAGHQIGETITIKAEQITDDKGNKKELLKNKEMEIVGIVESPLYISRERGSTKLGAGKIEYYMFVLPEAVNADFYGTAYITVEGAEELDCTTKQYENTVKAVKDKIEEISEERKQARYQEIYDEADKKIKEAEDTLNKEKQKVDKEIADAQKKIDDAKKEIENGKKEIENNRKKADTQFANAEKKLKEAENELTKNKKEFEKEKEIAEAQLKENKQILANLQEVRKQYQTITKNLTQKQKEQKALQEELNGLVPGKDDAKIEEINKKIQIVSREIAILTSTIKGIENSLSSQGISTSTLGTTISTLKKGIEQAEKQLKEAEKQISSGEKELKKQKSTLINEKSKAYKELDKAETKLKDGEKEITDNEKKLQEAKIEADEKINEAEEKLEQAKIDLKDIEKPEWYILDRKQNVGYASYEQDTDRIAKIAAVFPVVFFVVAALISLTSMSRMVEEERVQIGTLKALGYTKRAIASKYIVYALLASLVGSIIGLIIGFRLLPTIITDIYAMMYTLPETILEFNTGYTIIGIGAALLCTVGTTIYSCVRTLKQRPASLMRPKAPKMGKRVFLEKISWLWSRLNFTQKVTARNIFRYKKRFLMTVIGVTGCTALILAGFGLKDAVGQMIPLQYGEIFKYDLQISMQENITTNKVNEEAQKVQNMEQITNILQANMQSVEIMNTDNTQSIQLIVPEGADNLSEFITLREKKHRKNKYTLESDGVIITEKLAQLLDIKKGDSITLKNSDDKEASATVTGITENYLMHYIYMSPEIYHSLYGEEAKINTIFANNIEMTEEEQKQLGSIILKDKDYVSGISFISNTEDIFLEIMDSMNFVVWVLIIAAGLLAFVVLYNLSNTNISERIRELATIKVLGFYDKEVYDYVAREMIILTIIGIIIGLVAGVFLTEYIIKTCELDMFMFDSTIHWPSYIYAVLITITFAMIVNITTYFALRKINMIESLKSIE